MKINIHGLRKLNKPKVLGIIFALGTLALFTSWHFDNSFFMKTTSVSNPFESRSPIENPRSKTLFGLKFYRDKDDKIVNLTESYMKSGRQEEAELLSKISNQPTAIWLTGPNQSDPSAQADITTVARTSQAAAANGTTPIYILYAIPKRDACAEYSNGGFNNSTAYYKWVQSIIAVNKTNSVFVIEPDAVMHAVQGHCLSGQQIKDRYALINKTVIKLKESPHTIATYIDSGHSESFPDPSVLYEPLRKAGIQHANGVSVNVSNFISTPVISAWSDRLTSLLGGGKTAIIDTSRNGKGPVDASVRGDARWCNPRNRGIGDQPSVNVPDSHIDAYFWGKKPGESDGACFGNPEAGTLVPDLALELARNAKQ